MSRVYNFHYHFIERPTGNRLHYVEIQFQLQKSKKYRTAKSQPVMSLVIFFVHLVIDLLAFGLLSELIQCTSFTFWSKALVMLDLCNIIWDNVPAMCNVVAHTKDFKAAHSYFLATCYFILISFIYLYCIIVFISILYAILHILLIILQVLCVLL